MGRGEDDDLGIGATLAVVGDAHTEVGVSVSSAVSAANWPAVIGHRYEVLGLLGVGGMGRVYRVRDRVLDEVVALKVLRRELIDNPAMLERFRQEVRLARRVTHPNVVRTFDLGELDGETFLTMELVDGPALSALLEAGPLPCAEVVRIGVAVCQGVAAAHAAGVLHRDLKPDNVLVGRDGRIAVTDFGIARQALGDAGMTADRLVGTPAYMAPEQVDGGKSLSPATDVYALGAVLFEMLTGRRAFPGTDAIAVAIARLRQPPPDPRSLRRVSDGLAELVLRCMALDPAERFRDAGELESALAGLKPDAPGSTEVGRRAMAAQVPAGAARSVAVLPLRASGDLSDMAEGLSEELVDTLSMTRGLRVRPLASVRGAVTAEPDPQRAGALLGVDVVVDGSIRRLGAALRFSARAIGVVDGFQLWANRVDTSLEGLLAAADEMASAVARALTVELSLPERPEALDARATELYLLGKHKLRQQYAAPMVAEALPPLEQALAIAPDAAHIVAALALAKARCAFFGVGGDLAQARALAQRAIELAPAAGDGWLSAGVAALYDSDHAEAARLLSRAVSLAPGVAMGQAMLGGMLLEAGAVEEGLAHLGAAMTLDPTDPQAKIDAARGHAYEGRAQLAMQLVDEIPTEQPQWVFNVFATRLRLAMWRGVVLDARPPREALPEGVRDLLDALWAVHRGDRVDGGLLESMRVIASTGSSRLRQVRNQYFAEGLTALGRHDEAMEIIEAAVAVGLQDAVWMDRCPTLSPLRALPRFAAAREVVAARAAVVLAGVATGR